MRQIRAHREVIDALQIELIAREREGIVAEKTDERLEVVAVCVHRVVRDITLVCEVVEELSDLARHGANVRIPGEDAMADTELKKTPLNQAEHELGGKMVDFGGWELPVQYSGGILDEHQAVREHAGLCEVSDISEIP